MRTLATLLTLALGSSTGAAVPVEVEHGGLGSGKVFVTARFDGHDLRCLLDTGANGSSVAGDAFGQYPVVGQARAKGAANVASTDPEIEVGATQLGPLHAEKLHVTRLPGETGTIGMDLLGQRPFTLQFGPQPSLTWDDPRLPPSLPGLQQHLGEISLPVTLAGRPARALWDTGAGLTCVDRQLPERLPKAFTFVQEVNGGKDSTGQAVPMKLYKLDALQVGPERFHDLAVLAIDFSVIHEHLAPDLEILLGFNAITEADWSFDPARRLWAVRKP